MDLEINSAHCNVKKEDSTKDDSSSFVCVSKDAEKITEWLTNHPPNSEGQRFNEIDKDYHSTTPLKTELIPVSNFQKDVDDDDEDVRFLEMRLKVNKIMKIDLCEEMKISLENYYIKETEDIVKLQAGRIPKKIVLILDCRETVDRLKLRCKSVSGLTIFTIPKMKFKDSFAYIKKSALFNVGTVFVFNCGAFSLVEPKCLPECQQFFCLFKSICLDIRKPSPHLIEEAINLHKEILSSTLNDTAIFCSLIPIDVKRYNEYFLNNRKCKTNHRAFRMPKISDEALSDYYEEINNFNKFAKHHALKLGFEPWGIDNLWVDSLSGNGISLLNSRAVSKGQKFKSNFNALTESLNKIEMSLNAELQVEPRGNRDVTVSAENRSIKIEDVKPTAGLPPLSRNYRKFGKKNTTNVAFKSCRHWTTVDLKSFTKNAVNNTIKRLEESMSAIKPEKCETGEILSKASSNGILASEVNSKFLMNRTQLKNGQMFCELVRKANLANNFGCKKNSPNKIKKKKKSRKKKFDQRLHAEVVLGLKKTTKNSKSKNTDLNNNITKSYLCTSGMLVDSLSKNVGKGNDLHVEVKDVKNDQCSPTVLADSLAKKPFKTNDNNFISIYPPKMIVRSLTPTGPRRKQKNPKNAFKWKNSLCSPNRQNISLSAKKIEIKPPQMNANFKTDFAVGLSAMKKGPKISEMATKKGTKSSLKISQNENFKGAFNIRLMNGKPLRNFYEGGPELGMKTYDSFANNLSQTNNSYLKTTSGFSSRPFRDLEENQEEVVPLFDNPKISFQVRSRFDHFYFIGKKYLVHPFKRFGPRVTVIVHDLSHSDESNVPNIIGLLGPLHNNSICCLAFDFNIIAKTERVSENCDRFSCKSPVHIYSLTDSETSNWKFTDCINERLNTVRKMVFAFSCYLPTLLFPLRPSRVYFESKINAKTHLHIHSINRGSLYIVSGVKSSWNDRLDRFSFSWNAMVRENHENQSSILPLELFMHQYPSSLSCGDAPANFADQWTDSKLWYSVGEIVVNSFLLPDKENRKSVEYISTPYDDQILKNVPMKLRETSLGIESNTSRKNIISNFDDDLRDFISRQRKRKLNETSLGETDSFSIDKKGRCFNESLSSVPSLSNRRDNTSNDRDISNAALKTIFSSGKTISTSALNEIQNKSHGTRSFEQLPKVNEVFIMKEREKINDEPSDAGSAGKSEVLEVKKYGDQRESSTSSKDADIVKASDPQEWENKIMEAKKKLKLQLDDSLCMYAHMPELHPKYEKYYYDYLITQKTIFSGKSVEGAEDSSSCRKFLEAAINLNRKEEWRKLNVELSESFEKSSNFVNGFDDNSKEVFDYTNVMPNLNDTCKKIGILGNTLFSIIDYIRQYGIFSEEAREALSGTAIISLLNSVSVYFLELKSSDKDSNENRSLNLAILWTEKLKKLTDENFHKFSEQIDLWAVVVATVGKNSALILAVIRAIVANDKLSFSEEEIQDILMKICFIHIRLELKSQKGLVNAVSLPRKKINFS